MSGEDDNHAAISVMMLGGIAYLVRDTFTDDDDTLLSAHTSDVGGSPTANSSDGEIQGNLLEPTAAAVANVTWDTSETDVDIRADITIRTTTNNSQVGFVARVTDANNGFWIRYSPTDDPTELLLNRQETGNNGTVASAAWNPTIGNTYAWRLVVSGNDFELFIDDSSVLTGTDSFNNTATSHGYFGFGIGASPQANNQEMDDLTIQAA